MHFLSISWDWKPNRSNTQQPNHRKVATFTKKRREFAHYPVPLERQCSLPFLRLRSGDSGGGGRPISALHSFLLLVDGFRHLDLRSQGSDDGGDGFPVEGDMDPFGGLQKERVERKVEGSRRGSGSEGAEGGSEVLRVSKHEGWRGGTCSHGVGCEVERM